MDEILVNNFMVFDDLLADERYDLVVGDEAWDVDYFLHENPELKRSPFVWMTDFVGWLPMPAGGDREAALTADYNAEMIEQVTRYPAPTRPLILHRQPPMTLCRGRSGPGLPSIDAWTAQHFEFTGYVTAPPPDHDRARLRAALGLPRG